LVSRPRKFKFYLDENLPVPAGNFLRSLGHNVIEGLKILKREGATDLKHLKESTKQDAILLAYDRDFKVDSKYQEMIRKSPGVILVEATNTKTDTTKNILIKILKSLTINQIKGKVLCASNDKLTYIDPAK
jgi:predicted nuclease of predicted toxin-antitoxin system